MNPNFIKAKIHAHNSSDMKAATKFSNVTAFVSGKIAALALIIFVGSLASGILLIQLQ